MNSYQDLLKQQEIVSSLIEDTKSALYALEHLREYAWQSDRIDDVIEHDRAVMAAKHRLEELEDVLRQMNRQILWEDTKLSIRTFVRNVKQSVQQFVQQFVKRA